MLDIATVTQDIEHWIKNFVEVPHPALGGWAPCPYARKARLDQDYVIRVGVNPYFDLLTVGRDGLGGCSVLILAYDPNEFFYTQCWYLRSAPKMLNDLTLHPKKTDLPVTYSRYLTTKKA